MNNCHYKSPWIVLDPSALKWGSPVILILVSMVLGTFGARALASDPRDRPAAELLPADNEGRIVVNSNPMIEVVRLNSPSSAGGDSSSRAGGATYAAYRLTNRSDGFATLSLQLTLAGDDAGAVESTQPSLVVDVNLDGRRDSGDHLADTVSLAVGESKTILVSMRMPVRQAEIKSGEEIETGDMSSRSAELLIMVAPE